MGFASERLAFGMAVCQELTMERPCRTWSEQVLAYSLAEWWLVTPRGWSLDETSREVRLPESGLAAAQAARAGGGFAAWKRAL